MVGTGGRGIEVSPEAQIPRALRKKKKATLGAEAHKAGMLRGSPGDCEHTCARADHLYLQVDIIASSDLLLQQDNQHCLIEIPPVRAPSSVSGSNSG